MTAFLRRKNYAARAIEGLLGLAITIFLASIAVAQSATLQDTDLIISTTTGSRGIIFQDGTKQITAAAGLKTTEVMVSSGDVSSNVSSVSITLPTGTKTPYRVVYALKKDGTAGTIAVYTNSNTSGVWTLRKYGAGGAGAILVNTTATGCLISLVTNNQDADSILQGQFYFTSLFQSDKVGLIYGLETFSNGNAGNIGHESGGCVGPTESGNISTIGFRALTGNIALMHWEIWQGVTH